MHSPILVPKEQLSVRGRSSTIHSINDLFVLTEVHGMGYLIGLLFVRSLAEIGCQFSVSGDERTQSLEAITREQLARDGL